jgi:SAM-dependent methyltransferase
MQRIPSSQHNDEIAQNLRHWEAKPLLRKLCDAFYREIARHVRHDLPGLTVEVGSGIANLKNVLPDAIATDIFPNPWLDRTENAYRLSFTDSSIANLILFDVFHHLEFPGTALEECRRVLQPGGRVIIFDPAVSLLGFLVYGVFHHEPIGWHRPIIWLAPKNFDPNGAPYYAAQGNATRIFFSDAYKKELAGWSVHAQRMAAISYIASGGYRRTQLYPTQMLGFMRMLDRACDTLPKLFATRLLVALEKP